MFVIYWYVSEIPISFRISQTVFFFQTATYIFISVDFETFKVLCCSYQIRDWWDRWLERSTCAFSPTAWLFRNSYTHWVLIHLEELETFRVTEVKDVWEYEHTEECAARVQGELRSSMSEREWERTHKAVCCPILPTPLLVTHSQYMSFLFLIRQSSNAL